MASSPRKLNKILLTGPPGIGKTTLVQKTCSVLNRKGVPTTGFFTEELRNGRQRVGFNVVTVDGKTGPLARLSTNVPSSQLERMPRVGPYAVDIESFESLALQSLKSQLKEWRPATNNSKGHHNLWYDIAEPVEGKFSLMPSSIVILDEIGKMEIFSKKFKCEVIKVFDGPNTVLATIPMPKGRPIPFIENLKKRPHVKIITVTRENRNVLEDEITVSLLPISN